MALAPDIRDEIAEAAAAGAAAGYRAEREADERAKQAAFNDFTVKAHRGGNFVTIILIFVMMLIGTLQGLLSSITVIVEIIDLFADLSTMWNAWRTNDVPQRELVAAGLSVALNLVVIGLVIFISPTMFYIPLAVKLVDTLVVEKSIR